MGRLELKRARTTRGALSWISLFLSLGVSCPAVCEILSVDEIRAPQTMYHEALDTDVELTIRNETSLRNASCEIRVTSHAGTLHAVYPGYRLRLWRVTDRGFGLLEKHSGHGEIVVESCAADGRQLLFIQDVNASAGANWVATVIYYISSDCELRTVEFDPAEACGVELPRLTIESSTRGSAYVLQNNVIRFSEALWCPDDSPNFPTGGQVEGTLTIRAVDDGRLVADVSECRRDEHLCGS